MLTFPEVCLCILPNLANMLAMRLNPLYVVRAVVLGRGGGGGGTKRDQRGGKAFLERFLRVLVLVLCFFFKVL